MTTRYAYIPRLNDPINPQLQTALSSQRVSLLAGTLVDAELALQKTHLTVTLDQAALDDYVTLRAIAHIGQVELGDLKPQYSRKVTYPAAFLGVFAYQKIFGTEDFSSFGLQTLTGVLAIGIADGAHELYARARQRNMVTAIKTLRDKAAEFEGAVPPTAIPDYLKVPEINPYIGIAAISQGLAHEVADLPVFNRDSSEREARGKLKDQFREMFRARYVVREVVRTSDSIEPEVREAIATRLGRSLQLLDKGIYASPSFDRLDEPRDRVGASAINAFIEAAKHTPLLQTTPATQTVGL